MERKKRTLKEELKDDANLRRLAVVVRDSNDAIMVEDFSGRILAWNRGAVRMYGYTEKEALGMSALDIVPEECREENRRILASLERGELITSYETRRLTKDGRVLDVWLIVTTLPDEEGGIRTFSTTERNISERKRAEEKMRRSQEELSLRNRELQQRYAELQGAEEALRGSETRYRDLADSEQLKDDANLRRLAVVVRDSNDAITVQDFSGRILAWNLGAVRMYGYTEKEALGMSALDIVPEDSREENLRMLASLERGELITSYETRRVTKDGRVLDVWLIVTTLSDEEGGIRTFFTTERNISERKQAEEARRRNNEALAAANEELRISEEELASQLEELQQSRDALKESEEKYRLLSEFTWDWVYWLDNDYRFAFSSPSCERITGYAAEEFLRDPALLMGIVHPEDRALMAEHRKAFHSSAEHGELEFRIVRRDGEVRWIGHVCKAVVTEDGRCLGRRSGNRDITERKRAEEQIKKLNAELERRVLERTAQLETVNKELEAFSYSVSHDLRAPLRAIDGFSVALVEDFGKTLEEGAKAYLDRIRTGVKRMADLIDALLTLSRLSRAEMTSERLDLSALARIIVTDLEKSQPGRKAEWRIAEGLIAQGDPILLRALLENLLGNAWKFTSKEASPVIEFGAMAQEDGKLAYFLRDNGAGFDMAYSNKLFGAFKRLHTTTEFPGLGIGLATVQRIIHRHGGRVWAEGEVGKGAAFYFTLT